MNNQEKLGDTLEYRITYTNNGASPISGLSVTDATPAYTSFISAIPFSAPASLTSCLKQTPANPTPAATVACSIGQTAGGTGIVSWKFLGCSVNPGASGTVILQVLVN